jgi:transcriptional regulator with XRE-family HTH domain
MPLDKYTLKQLTNRQILEELGEKLRVKRINARLTQKELAINTGVGKATVQRLEQGQSVSLENFVAVIRGLEELSMLYNYWLSPEPISPAVLYKLEKQKKQRVKKSKKNGDKNSDFRRSAHLG